MKESLKHFVGKPCTVTTIAINYRFNPEQMNDYFMGMIESIDDHGILMYHASTKCKNYIFFPHIVSITEEQLLFEDNPEHAKIIEEYRKEKPITAAKTALTEQSKFINPSALAELAQRIKVPKG